MSVAEPHYWAFISYSHADKARSKALHRALERFRVPRSLVGQQGPHGSLPKRLFPIFRDQDELASSDELGPRIREALARSRFLIVVCSPNAARSHWVNEEIRSFKAAGRANKVLCAIIDGNPAAGSQNDCFPPAIRQRIDPEGAIIAEDVEPLAADFRPGSDDPSDALTRLAAGLLGLPFDQLKRRELIERNRRLRLLVGAAGLVMAALLGLTLVAYQARDAARDSRARADALVTFMLSDLSETLASVGRLDAINQAGDQAIAYFNALDPSGRDRSVGISRAKAMLRLGTIRFYQARYPEGIELLTTARTLLTDAMARMPDDADLASSYVSILEISWDSFAENGQLEAANALLPELERVVSRFLTRVPQDPKWNRHQSQLDELKGKSEAYKDRYLDAIPHYAASRERLLNLHARFPQDIGHLTALVQTIGWGARAYQYSDDNAAARRHYEQGVVLARKLVALAPDDTRSSYALTVYLLDLVDANLKADRLTEALQVAIEAVELSQFLAQRDPNNESWQDLISPSMLRRSLIEYRLGQKTKAITTLDMALRVSARNLLRWPDTGTARKRHSTNLLLHADFLASEPNRETEVVRDAEALLALWPADRPSDVVNHIAGTELLLWEIAQRQSRPNEAAAHRQRASALIAEIAQSDSKRAYHLRYKALDCQLGPAEDDEARKRIAPGSPAFAARIASLPCHGHGLR